MDLSGETMKPNRLCVQHEVVVFAMCFGVCSTVLVGQTKQGMASNDSIASAIEEYGRSASSFGFSGTLLVARGRDVICQNGYGWANQAEKIPNGIETVYYIASLSKQFTATAVLLLEAEGKLKTTDKISTYLKDVPSDKAEITIHQLLTHSSGLPRFGWDESRNDWSVMTRDEAVSGILHQKLDQAPGTIFRYQNANYILLAAVVETLSGKTFQEFVRERLLGPAGIHSALFGIQSTPDRATMDKVALGYSDGSPTGSYLNRPKSWLRVGAGDMLISIGDLYRWHLALRDGKILPAHLCEKLFTIQMNVDSGFGYAYGWWVRQIDNRSRVVFHGGDFNGYHCEFRWYPESDLYTIVAANSEFHGGSITEKLLNDVNDITKGRRSPLPHVITIGSDQLNRFRGDYDLPNGGGLHVSSDGGQLEIEAEGPIAADILANADPAGTKERELYGNSTLNLIARLKRGELTAYADALASQVAGAESEFKEEWESLGVRMGRLKSYQLLSTIFHSSDEAALSYVRLNFDHGSTVMGYAWKKGKLEYTIPGARPEPGTVVFVPSTPFDFSSFDWRSGKLMKISFIENAPEGMESMKLQGHNSQTYTLTKRIPSK